MPEIPIRLVKETSTTITLGWDPPPAVQWYLFYAEGVRVSNAPPVDKAGVVKDTIKFSKGAEPYRVVAVTRVNGVFAVSVGTYITAQPEPPPTRTIKFEGDTLTWSATPGATSYNVYDSGATPPYVPLGSDIFSYKAPARPGTTVQYDVEARKANEPIPPGWYGRVSHTWPGTPPPPPPDPVPSGDQIICIEVAAWAPWSDLKPNGIGYYRCNSGGWNNIAAAKQAGMVCAVTCVGEGGRIGDIDPARYAADLKAFVVKHGLTRVEVLNEPEGNWFWSDAGNAVHLTAILKASKAALAGTGCKVLASFQPKDGFQDKMIAAGAVQYVDEVVVHPYGGASKSASSAAGNRQMVIDVNRKTGKKIAITEVGWPTATGQPATGDSAQWTEQEQAANIVDFCKWVRANPQMISMMSLFHYVDYGSNMHYGIVRSNQSHKPSFAAFAPYAND